MRQYGGWTEEVTLLTTRVSTIPLWFCRGGDVHASDTFIEVLIVWIRADLNICAVGLTHRRCLSSNMSKVRRSGGGQDCQWQYSDQAPHHNRERCQVPKRTQTLAQERPGTLRKIEYFVTLQDCEATGSC